MFSLSRRQFLRTAAATAGGLVVVPALPLGLRAAEEKQAGFTLPKLPYGYDALEDAVDARTMEIHHLKHHQAYVDNLNKALAKHPDLMAMQIGDLMANVDKVPKDIRQAVINNGGGHLNHSMFWQMMAPRNHRGEPRGDLLAAIDSTFGGVAKLQEAMNDAGLKRFGSGWSWLVKGKDGKLSVVSTANQDPPVMQGLTPLLGVDVWEHAYYLRYQNRRADYLKAWWNVVNWNDVAERFQAAGKNG